MSSHVVVIASDFRRTTIKVSPGTYLSDVLQQACLKLNLNSDKYLIKHKQKHVDLSVPFRTSGLVQGAKLELVQKSNTPSAIQVALQIPQPEAREIPGGRLIRKFPSDLTLWQILRQFESGDASAGKNVNVTARGVAQVVGGASSGTGQLYYEMPVLNLMGRELASFADFQKTLSQLGYNSGSVLIRLSFRKTEQTLYEAMEEIGKFFTESEQPPGADVAPTQGEERDGNAGKDNGKDVEMDGTDATPTLFQETTKPTEEAQGSTEASAAQPESDPSASTDATSPSASKDPYQPVNIFLAPSGSVPVAALATVDERDYTPTIAHAQLHQSRLLQSSRNKRLPSDKELEEKAAAEEAKIAAIKSVLVKVRFPDNTSSEWQVGRSETGAFLYEAVRHIMARRDLPFRLVLPGTGGGSVISDDSTPKHTLIKAYKLSGRVLVSLVWDDAVPADVRIQPFLKPRVAEMGKAVKVPEVPTVTAEKESSRLPPPPTSDSAEKGSGDGSGKKVPKWFKFGKK